MKKKTLSSLYLIVILLSKQPFSFSQVNKSTYAVISAYDNVHGVSNDGSEFYAYPILLTDLEGNEIKFKNGIVKNKKISKLQVTSQSDLEKYKQLINNQQIVYYIQQYDVDQYWNPKDYFLKRPRISWVADQVPSNESSYNKFINHEYSFATFKESAWYGNKYAVLNTDNYLDKFEGCKDNISINLMWKDEDKFVFLHSLTNKIKEGWSIDKIEKIFLKIVPNFYTHHNYNGNRHTGKPEKLELINLVRNLKHLPEAKKYFSSSEFRYSTIAIYEDDAIFNTIQNDLNNKNLISTYNNSEIAKNDLLNKLQVAPTYLANLPHNLVKCYPMFSEYIKENSLALILNEQDNSYNFCMVGSDFVEYFPDYVKNNSKFVTKYKTCKFTEPKDISFFELFARSLLSGKREGSSLNSSEKLQKKVGIFEDFKKDAVLQFQGEVPKSIYVNSQEKCPCLKYELNTGSRYRNSNRNGGVMALPYFTVYKTIENKWFNKAKEKTYSTYDELLLAIYNEDYE